MKLQRLRRRSLISLAALLLLLITGTPADGQAVGANRGDSAVAGFRRTIKGKLYLPGGNSGIPRFKIRLDNPDIGTLTTISDQDGEFNFNGIVAGSYSLTIEQTNEYEATHESVYIEAVSSGPLVIIPIYLRRRPGADPALAGVPKVSLDAYLKGMEAARSGKTEKAIEAFEAAVAAYPKLAPAFNELGVQYLKLGRPDKAAAVLETAVKLAPEEFYPRLNYGIALLNQKKFAQSEEQLRLALKKNEAAPTAHMYLGIALMSQQKLDEAEKELQIAANSKSSEVATAHRYLGGIYWGKRDYNRAADELETYLKLAPRAADAERTRAAIKDLRNKQ